LIRKTLKGAVNNGGDGDKMEIASREFGEPKCGYKSQYIRFRWVQSKKQKLNKPHR
jgi:hypothetical protein